tara:strand:+ start:288 stop:995 length:708 start_codon:yes stop_codon:yes gene_type:complete
MDIPPDKNILFHSHLGLGDQIGCIGLVHYLADTYKRKIGVVCKECCLRNVEFLYKDFPNIQVFPVSSNPSEEISQVDNLAKEKNYHLVRTTITDPHDEYWDKTHYSNLGLDYQIKFDYCKLPTIPNSEEILSRVGDITGDSEKFAFVHDDEDLGLTFEYNTSLPVVKNQKDLNLFEMIPILEKASEIHVMGSSLLCLAEVLNVPLGHQKAFFYSFRDTHSVGINIWNKDKWKIFS